MTTAPMVPGRTRGRAAPAGDGFRPLLSAAAAALACLASPLASGQSGSPSYAVWGSMTNRQDDGGRFRAQVRDAADTFVAANTAYGSLPADTVVVAGGRWNSGSGKVESVVIDAEGTRDHTEEAGADGRPRGHLSTTLGVGAGSRSPEPRGFFKGDIAEVLVYGRALSDAESERVETHLRARHLGGGAAEDLPVTRGLILHLDPASLDGQSGDLDRWEDASGNGNDAVSEGQPPRLSEKRTPAGGPMVRFQGDSFLKIASNPADFDGDGRTWYVVFSTFSFNNARMINSAYDSVSQPLVIAPGDGFERLRYNHPDLMVRLGVGLWGNPLPMDLDGDGELELLAAGTATNDNAIYRFDRRDPEDPTQFTAGARLSRATKNLQVSELTDGSWVLTSPGRRYDRFDERGLSHWTKIPFDPPFYIGRSNLWRFYDFDHDGVDDLTISLSDWRDYGWDDAYDEEGNWIRGPITGQVWWMKNTGTNAEPAYAEPVQVLPGGKDLEIYGDPAASFADFDGDGLDDMMCGEFLDRLTFFRNVGSPTEPEFAEGVRLSGADGDYRMEVEMIMPVASDWDNDGHVDVIVGEETGEVAWLRNLGTVSDGVPDFAAPAYFMQEAYEIKIGVLPTPTVTDWNGDGLDDILTGDSAGFVSFVENLGGEPRRWAAPVRVEAGGEVIRIQAGENGSIQGPAEAKWGYSVVNAADWDGDGLTDLLLNNIFGRILWYRNVGSAEDPRLAAAEPVEVAWDGPARSPAWDWWKPADDELVLQWRTSVQAIDLTGDGVLDLVGVDEDGYLAMFEGRRVEGRQVVGPGQRVFHMAEGEENVLDPKHRNQSYDEDGDGVNDLSVLDENGKLPFYAVVQADGEKKKMTGPLRFADRSNDPRYADPDNATALRANAGWAGRAGRRKFVLVDWDLDGRLDLLMNSRNLNFLRNVSEEPGGFVFEDMGLIDDLRIAGHSVCPAAADFDGNGVPDVVLGAEDGYLYHMVNPHTPTPSEPE